MMKHIAIVLVGFGVAVMAATLQWSSAPADALSPLHPNFPLLDAAGNNVLESGLPVSAEATCGDCHNTEFISAHTDHSDRVFGGVEQNCFLCHLENPDNAGRRAAISSGNADWATTATISGLVDENWQYVIDTDISLNIQDPTIENCGQCHGAVHTDLTEPFTLDACGTSGNYTTRMTGQVFSAQQISQSGLNIANKNEIARSWDIHAERVVECVGCHYSENNPTQFDDDADLDHLIYDPRRLDFGEYLQRPSHNLDQNSCTTCHDADHDWLPYQERHLDVLACESCHIPELHAPAIASIDYTVMTAAGTPLQDCRGMDEDESLPLLTGYEPVLLQLDDKLVPHNLVTRWYWMDGDESISNDLIHDAYLDDAGYLPAVLDVFDENGDGELSTDELVLDSDAKLDLISDNLKALGATDPQIIGETTPYRISHGVTDLATRECEACHAGDSRVSQDLLLSANHPSGVTPQLDGFEGEIVERGDALYFQPTQKGLYILGHDSTPWVDWLGMAMLLGTFAGVGAHGGLRIFAARSRKPEAAEQHPDIDQIYMYSVYERQWHWLQAMLIFGLMFTGLVIHKPDTFGMFSFRSMVLIHNVMALILVVNAALALFYHLASGEIQQFLPRPRGYFSGMIEQALFYTRGIFKGEEHPFEKTRNRKLNPIQQMTYFMILNVLLPIQVISGALLWGAQRWPEAADAAGGLTWLATAHALAAWSFASFIIVHVYMTTTGHTPLAGIRSMLTGWDDIETHHHDTPAQQVQDAPSGD